MKMAEDKTKPTNRQYAFVEDLMSRLGYNETDIPDMCDGKELDELTRKEMSDLIDDLMDEWERC